MRRQRGRCVIHSPTIDVDAAPKTPPGDDADVKDLRATPAADGYKYVLRSTGHALPRRTTVTRSTRLRSRNFSRKSLSSSPAGHHRYTVTARQPDWAWRSSRPPPPSSSAKKGEQVKNKVETTGRGHDGGSGDLSASAQRSSSRLGATD